MNRRSFAVKLFFTLVAAFVAAGRAFGQSVRERHVSPEGHVPPERYQHRLKWNSHERAWLAIWREENGSHTWYQPGILAHVLDREPTPEEKTAVAGVIQWFGTNCGHCFITEALRAQGYRVEHDEALPNAAVFDTLRRDFYFPGIDLPSHIKFEWHGRQINI